jgi:hypothetical protein
MEIESTTFGTITIDGKTYEHDVVIRLSGDVVKRYKGGRRPKNPQSMHCAIWPRELERFRNNWALVDAILGATSSN